MTVKTFLAYHTHSCQFFTRKVGYIVHHSRVSHICNRIHN